MQTESARCPIRDDGSVKQVNQVPKPGGNSIALLLSQLFPNDCRGGQNGPGSGITRFLRQRRTFGRRFLKVHGSIYSHLRPPNALSRDLFEAGLGGGFNCYQPGQHIFACGVSLLPHRKWTRRLLWRKFPATGIRRSESALALPKLKSPVPFETGPSLDGSGSETRLLLRGVILRPLSGKTNPLLVCAAGQRVLGRPAKLSSAYGHARSMIAIHCRHSCAS